MNLEQKQPESINLEFLKYKLTNFLLGIEVEIAESDSENMLHELMRKKPAKRDNLLASGAFTDAEKNYIRKHTS